MIRRRRAGIAAAALTLIAGLFTPVACAAASAEEAATLRTTLTPLGGERAGNREGTIPPWTGGYATPIPGEQPEGRRGDPFAVEKPLFSITSKNVDQYADKLTDGVKAMLAKYPDTYRVDVYPTHRTAIAPQWVYDNTFRNATRAKIVNDIVEDAFGGIPFPIPKSGEEVMWNHLLRWRGESVHSDYRQYQLTSDGRTILTREGTIEHQFPYYYRDGSAATFKGDYWVLRITDTGPPIHVGEMLVGRANVDEATSKLWVYLTGQRRVRRLPVTCCDVPAPPTSGLMSLDEIAVWQGRLTRFDWKIVGKREMYVPYNANGALQPPRDGDVIGKHHLVPDYVRFELHRVWVIESTLRPGQRHQAPKGRYYVDEDTWIAVLGDRWDANGQLWKTIWSLPTVMPDFPGTLNLSFGFNDLLTGAAFISDLYNESKDQFRPVKRYSDSTFTPDAMAGEGVR
ncbi:MAG TPA: DUF1329 domain-containing protein [Casimicrobiaceae bacterium]